MWSGESLANYVRIMNNGKEKYKETDKAILCLVDLSDASQSALRWATSMARTLNAHLTILYTYRFLQPVKTEVLLLKKQSEGAALKKFLEWESEILADKHVNYDFRSEVGFVADRVEDYVSKNPVILLAIHKPIVHDNKETVQQLIDQLKVPMVIIP